MAIFTMFSKLPVFFYVYMFMIYIANLLIFSHDSSAHDKTSLYQAGLEEVQLFDTGTPQPPLKCTQ